MSRRAAVVIPVLDEVASIAALLDDLRAQERAPDEVVVVDAGSQDGTRALVEAMAAGWPALRVLAVAGAPPARARNAGIAAADAELIACVDAGSRVGPRWLAALLDALHDDPGAVCIGVTAADARTPFEEAAAWFTLRGFKPPDRPGPVGREFLPAGRSGYCFAKRTWQAAGGYPDELRFSEDKTFLRRTRACGAQTIVAPGAVVRWRPRRSLPAVYRQYRNYGFGDGFAAIDQQNELVPLALLTVGGSLALRAASGDRRAGAALAAAATAYLGLFAGAAARELGPRAAVAWVPPIRLTVDVAKVHGFIAGTVARRRSRARERAR